MTPQAEYLTSFDGTRLRYSVHGAGPHTLVLSPGLATPPCSYDRIVDRFADEITIVTWDQRGTYRSDWPESGFRGMRVEDNAADCLAIVDQLGLEQFLLGGWSMGVQISLEFQHRFRSRVQGLLLMNGGFGDVMKHTALPLSGFVAPGLARTLSRFGGVVGPVFRAGLPRHGTVRALRRLGLIADNEDAFLEVLSQWSQLDFRRYFGMIRVLGRHSAETYLRDVAVPTVITAGTNDIMTPIATARHMAREIPDAELVVARGGTHYTPIEFPHLINQAVSRLLERTVRA